MADRSIPVQQLAASIRRPLGVSPVKASKCATVYTGPRHLASRKRYCTSKTTDSALLFTISATYSWQAMSVRAVPRPRDWPTVRAVGGGGASGAEPAQAGGISPKKKVCRP